MDGHSLRQHLSGTSPVAFDAVCCKCCPWVMLLLVQLLRACVPQVHHTMRPGNTTKVLAERMLMSFRIVRQLASAVAMHSNPCILATECRVTQGAVHQSCPSKLVQGIATTLGASLSSACGY